MYNIIDKQQLTYIEHLITEITKTVNMLMAIFFISYHNYIKSSLIIRKHRGPVTPDKRCSTVNANIEMVSARRLGVWRDEPRRLVGGSDHNICSVLHKDSMTI